MYVTQGTRSTQTGELRVFSGTSQVVPRFYLVGGCFYPSENMSQIGNLHRKGVNIKNICNHQLATNHIFVGGGVPNYLLVIPSYFEK